MIFLAWLRRLGVADGATQAVQALLCEPVISPALDLAGAQVASPLLDQKPGELPGHVPVGSAELVRRVAGAKVGTPAAQDRVQLSDQDRQLRPHAIAAGAGPDL